jgi:hypothetical protein
MDCRDLRIARPVYREAFNRTDFSAIYIVTLKA